MKTLFISSIARSEFLADRIGALSSLSCSRTKATVIHSKTTHRSARATAVFAQLRQRVGERATGDAILEHCYMHLPGRGIALEALKLPAAGNSAAAAARAPPVILIHGSLHGAWAWEPFLVRWHAAGGLAGGALAVSLRGPSCTPPLEPGAVVPLMDHVQDIVALVKLLAGVGDEPKGPPPILLGHSIGGYYCQRVVQSMEPGSIAGMVLLASTPPSGNGALVWRSIFKQGLYAAWKITMGFVRNTVSTDINVCRYVFFTRQPPPQTDAENSLETNDSGNTMTSFDKSIEGDNILQGYMVKFARSGQNRLNTRDITPMRRDLRAVHGLAGRVLVLGGADDVIVDEIALEEAADFWDVKDKHIVFSDCPHDLMLASKRDLVADTIIEWIDRTRF